MADQQRHLQEANSTDDDDDHQDSPTPNCLVSKFERLELDRFIPNRSTTNWDYGRAVLTGRRPSERNYGEVKFQSGTSEHQVLYTMKLKKELGLDTSRIFYYRNNRNPPEVVEYAPRKQSASMKIKPADETGQNRPKARYVPGIRADKNYLNLLDWGMLNWIAIGIQATVCFWDLNKADHLWIGSYFGDLDLLISSVSWCSEGSDVLAIGLEKDVVYLMDPTTNQMIRTFNSWGVGSLAWNGRVLSTGNLDGDIVNYDMRVENKVSRLPESHGGAICGMKWSASGQLLASGGSDNVVHVWDARSMPTKSLHKFEDHNATVRAVAWNPLKRHLLASGGGQGDHYIRLWDARSGTPHNNAVDTGSEVNGLLWSKHHGDILFSSHGYGDSQSVPDNRLILWRSPMMFKINEVHRSYCALERQRLRDETDQRPTAFLCSTQSPDGHQVALAGDDDVLKFYDVFTEPAPPKPAANPPFSTYNRPNHYTLR